MAYRANADNIYPEGTLVTAKIHPSLQLVIIKYLQRIYYCAPVDDKQGKQQAYFEREILPVNPLKVTS
jgi:hypothetical protein